MYAPRQKVHALLGGVFQAAVVEQVEAHPSDAQQDRFYVHWAEHDRRLDAWLAAGDIRPLTTTAAAPKSAKAAQLATSSVMTRRMTRDQEGPGAAGAAEGPAQAVGRIAIKGSAAARTRAGSAFFGLPKNVSSVVIGGHEMDAWYFSPYPQARTAVRRRVEALIAADGAAPPAQPFRASALRLHMCPCCLSAFPEEDGVIRHLGHCVRHPPGREVYRDAWRGLLVFEVSGTVDAPFCQSLALLSKLFLEHKALDFDTTPFVFYVLCHVTAVGCEVVGYFSREKDSPEQYNLSCIMTLPHFQGCGAGRFLIELSYEMSRRCGGYGSPEKPLSDLGERSYRAYWAEVLLDLAVAYDGAGVPFSVDAVAKQTGIAPVDITATLQQLHVGEGGRIADIPANVLRTQLRRRCKRLESSERDFTFDPLKLGWMPSEYVVAKVRGAGAAPSMAIFSGAL